MASLEEIRDKYRALQSKLLGMVGEAMQQKSEVAADLVAGQLAMGIKANGKESDFVYSDVTIAIKEGKTGLASVTDHLTNYDTGESYQKLYMAVNGRTVTFGTKSDKEKEIDGRMDGLAFGLTDDSQEEFLKNHVHPLFIQDVENHLSS